MVSVVGWLVEEKEGFNELAMGRDVLTVERNMWLCCQMDYANSVQKECESMTPCLKNIEYVRCPQCGGEINQVWFHTYDALSNQAIFIAECWSGDTTKTSHHHLFKIRVPINIEVDLTKEQQPTLEEKLSKFEEQWHCAYPLKTPFDQNVQKLLTKLFYQLRHEVLMEG